MDAPLYNITHNNVKVGSLIVRPNHFDTDIVIWFNCEQHGNLRCYNKNSINEAALDARDHLNGIHHIIDLQFEKI